MANNVFADKPAAIVAKTSISFASAGLDATKVRVIYEVGDPLKSFIPGRAINAITGFTQDKGYYMVPAVDLDLSAIVAPPLDAANITPPAPTAGIVDDTANTFDWTNAAGYVTADHETSINGGTTWTAATKPLSVGDVSLAIGQVMVRVKAATGRNAGPTLSNATAFNTGNITPAAPTAGVVDDTADTFNWTNNPTYTALSDYEYTLDGGSTYSTVTAKPISVGNVAKAIGQVGVRVKAATGRNVSATLFNASAFNVAAGDTTPPTVVSATAINANTVRVVFSEVVTDSITAGSMAFKKNGAANNPTARSGSGTNTVDYTVPTMAAGDTILRTYVPATGDIKDAAGNELAAFTDVAVTNSIPASADADATAFNTAAGITDNTQKAAINQLVVDIKAAGLWANMKAIYPLVGGTAASHKYNLKDPQDTDAAFRLSFLGTITHNANGATGDGTTGYADTFLNDTTHITGNPITIGSYSRTNGNTGFSMGCNGSGGTYIADRNSLIARVHDTSDGTTAIPNQQRLIIITRTAGGVVNHYKDGTQLVNTTPAVSGRINFKYFLFGMSNSGAATGFSDKNYCFFFIYDGGMTQTEATALTNAVNTYQTTLGRNV